jgi:hypothetical protein
LQPVIVAKIEISAIVILSPAKYSLSLKKLSNILKTDLASSMLDGSTDVAP